MDMPAAAPPLRLQPPALTSFMNHPTAFSWQEKFFDLSIDVKARFSLPLVMCLTSHKKNLSLYDNTAYMLSVLCNATTLCKPNQWCNSNKFFTPY